MARELSGKKTIPVSVPRQTSWTTRFRARPSPFGHDTSAVVWRCEHHTTTCSRILAPNYITLGSRCAALKKTHVVKLTWYPTWGMPTPGPEHGLSTARTVGPDGHAGWPGRRQAIPQTNRRPEHWLEAIRTPAIC